MIETDDFVFVYTTLPDLASAESLAENLVERRLAACANIYPAMRSVFEWEGDVVHDDEVGCFIKTRRDLAQAVIEAAGAVHPYDVPAFLILPIVGGAADYLGWVRAQTSAH